MTSLSLSPGSIIRARDREWVILPSPDDSLYLLRPLTGSDREICGIYKPLAELGLEQVRPAQFPLPSPDDFSDALGAGLLWDAARLALRDGAGPLRSLGKIAVRPRPYQFVPLLMSLRLDPIRLLIADDVGVGKTVEALLIAREMLDRGEIQRICVLCPPYLCDQWQQELWEKFGLEAVVVRSGAISRLERDLPSGDHSIFSYYRHLVVSIDYAKIKTETTNHRDNFLQHCPEFVIVDEAHGAARPAAQARAQQERHELLQALAHKADRHLLLLTATPHSGVEQAFLSLLGLLRPGFERLDMQTISEQERDALAKHFVQRRRGDVLHWMDADTPFPERLALEETYDLSPGYQKLFRQVFEFSQELVRSGETLSGWKKRVRYWTALALLRCVMSSPAAALTALQSREKNLGGEEEADDGAFSPYIYEAAGGETLDAPPAHIVESGEGDLGEADRKRLREFARLAEGLKLQGDAKLDRLEQIVRALLAEGHHPIVWCRYIATSDYVAEALAQRLNLASSDKRGSEAVRVISLTGALADDERRQRVAELGRFPRRVLAATDCLSEGINLQEHFSAVIHYDLPWNPNRLEQREGRVDRFGQAHPSGVVKAVLLYGRDNPVDGAVLDVLLRKAREIRKSLGVMVPVPVDSETVMEAVLKALFFRGPQPPQPQQLALPLFDQPEVKDFHRRLDQAAEREKTSRSRFAQRAIKPDEVQRELEASDAVLGDPQAVQRFVLNAGQRLKLSLRPAAKGVWGLNGLEHLPESVRQGINASSEARSPAVSPAASPGEWRVAFTTPAPENVAYLGRNHPFVAALAQHLLGAALAHPKEAPAARCAVLRTAKVQRRTSLLLLRLRFLLSTPGRQGSILLAEECLVRAFRGLPPDSIEWLAEGEAQSLLEAQPHDNIPPGEKREHLAEVLSWWDDLQKALEADIQREAERLLTAHKRVRASAGLAQRGLSITPQLPPDLLGLTTLLPLPKMIGR